MSPLGKPSVVKGKSGQGSKDRKPISVAPSDAVSGSGAPDNVDTTIVEMTAATWDYNGSQEPSAFLLVKLKDDDGTEHDQYYSAGDLSKIVPSDDGAYFYPAEGSSATGLNNNCNAYLFLGALVDQGFPEDKLRDEGFQTAVGLRGHMNAIAPKKKREGLEGGNKPIGVFTKIHSLPWEQKGKGSSSTSSISTRGSTSTQAASTIKNGDADELNTEAIEAVVAALAKADGPIEVKRLGMAAFQAAPKATHRKELIKYVTTNEFLKKEYAQFEFDDNKDFVMARE
jgi:hypothetical protein